MTPEQVMRRIYALRSRGVTDARVLTAFEKIDRAEFVPATFAERSEEDVPLPIASGQTTSQPSVIGLMAQAARIGPRDKVLEIGTGTGFQAAILSRLARRVYSVERHAPLARAARANLERLGITNVTVITGDGTRGLPEQAPFDAILVSAAAEDPPGPLLSQLREGGSMVLPVGVSDAVQTLIKVTRTEDGYEYDELMPVRFVPLVDGVEQD
ncbi:protein-L-isoaspartate(D-aspartate) O-methyltransferase [Jannaschia aquimarina]|uniref:Protein-L-isoaspartate O-methyltransferase n=1 Tax=Jannaschia aquimarina TaxID=935700 RepID=A0A0D1CIW5_9RHOB|nr:protein-L-isoaspartate(D-aspartate) O-methyltransferase [Jannaschia aquimarina]KIT14662.1 Protein-L-isoaspartate O-methyltransferase [Jannaschia aquimarina]SNT37813.1 protein-L-isoaspartate(D-aspartate) O-methyltransferase [Jannaschia aquimarina]